MGGIRNIVFDFGGVMVGYDPRTYLRDMFGDDPAGRYILEALFDPELVGRLDRGVSTRAAEYAPVLERADRDGFGPQARDVAERWIGEMMSTKDDTVALVGRLRRVGYRAYYLTNMPDDLWEIFTVRGLRDIFDGGVVSFVEKVTKPDPRIYRLLLDRYGLVPEETVFLDDMERNIDGASALGIHGILFSDAAQAERELNKMGVVTA